MNTLELEIDNGVSLHFVGKEDPDSELLLIFQSMTGCSQEIARRFVGGENQDLEVNKKPTFSVPKYAVGAQVDITPQDVLLTRKNTDARLVAPASASSTAANAAAPSAELASEIPRSQPIPIATSFSSSTTSASSSPNVGSDAMRNATSSSTSDFYTPISAGSSVEDDAPKRPSLRRTERSKNISSSLNADQKSAFAVASAQIQAERAHAMQQQQSAPNSPMRRVTTSVTGMSSSPPTSSPPTGGEGLRPIRAMSVVANMDVSSSSSPPSSSSSSSNVRAFSMSPTPSQQQHHHHQHPQQQQRQRSAASTTTTTTTAAAAASPASPAPLVRSTTVSSPSPSPAQSLAGAAIGTLFVGDLDLRSRSAKMSNAAPMSTLDERALSAKSAPSNTTLFEPANVPTVIGTLFVGDVDFVTLAKTKTTSTGLSSSSSPPTIAQHQGHQQHHHHASSSSSMRSPSTTSSMSSALTDPLTRHAQQQQIALQQQLRRNDVPLPEVVLQNLPGLGGVHEPTSRHYVDFDAASPAAAASNQQYVDVNFLQNQPPQQSQPQSQPTATVTLLQQQQSPLPTNQYVDLTIIPLDPTRPPPKPPRAN